MLLQMVRLCSFLWPNNAVSLGGRQGLNPTKAPESPVNSDSGFSHEEDLGLANRTKILLLVKI